MYKRWYTLIIIDSRNNTSSILDESANNKIENQLITQIDGVNPPKVSNNNIRDKNQKKIN